MRDLKERVAPRHTALLVVDMQNDFCHREGALNKAKDILPYYSVEMTERMTPRLLEVIDLARLVGAKVIYTRSEYSDWITSDVWRFRAFDQALAICRPGTWGADFFAVKPREDELVIVKPRYSPFVGTNIELALRAQGIRTVVLTGTATNVCVESTARDAFMRDFHVVCLRDCVATSVESVHEHSLANIHRHFGVVITSQELESLWKGAAA